METTTIEMTEPKKPGQITVGDVVNNTTWQIAGVISVLAFAVAYQTSFAWEWRTWMMSESEYSHGPLIPLISAFIVWFNWKRVSKISVQPSLWGLAALAPALFVLFAMHKSAGFSVGGLTIPVTLFAISLILFGKKTTKELAFPILFLFFMCVPPGSILPRISHEIQMESTRIATGGLRLLGFDVIREGISIQLPSITVQVAAACSGIRTLVLMLAFSTFLSYMLVGPLWGRLSLVVLVIPLAVITNSVRVLVVSLAGEYYGEEVMHQVHDYGGYVIVFISMILLFYIAKVLKCRDFRSMPTS